MVLLTAIDMSVALMNKGETAEVITAPRFAYGTKGRYVTARTR